MSTPVVPEYSAPYKPVPQITPFNYRDGVTMLNKLDGLKNYINKVLVPFVNDNYSDLADQFETQANLLIDTVNAALAAQTEEVAEAISTIDGKVAEAEAAKDAAVAAAELAEMYADQAGNASDGAMLAVWANLSSQFRQALDTEYAKETDLVALTAIVDDVSTEVDTKVSTIEFNAEKVATEDRDTALGLRIDGVEVDVNSRFSDVNYSIAQKMEALDFRITRPSEWGSPVGVPLSIPTHVVPATGQVAHPSVLYFPERWNGYRYWMAYTPYPGNNDDHEDPNLAVSNDGVSWIHAPGVPQPLDDVNGTPYNSDPDLVMGPDQTMYLFWRYYDPAASSNQEKLYMRTSKDGVTWTPKALVWEYNDTVLRPLSPSFIFEDDRWTCYFVDGTTTRTFRRMVSLTNQPDGGWGAAQTLTITPGISGKEVWHVEVRRIGGALVGLMNVINPTPGGVGGLIQLITSVDGVNWVGSAETVVPQVYSGQHNNLYRASFFAGYNDGYLGLWVYYSAFQDSPQPNVWNIYRTFLGPNGKGEQFTLTPGPNITITNLDARARDGFAYGTFDWTKTAALAHADVIATFPTNISPVVNDTVDILGPAGTTPYMGVIAAASGVIQANNPPASKTVGTVRFKIPINPR